MTAPAFGTLLSGGELAGVGITAAGWRHAWGVEYDPAIAAVAQANGFHGVRVADVLDCDPRDFEPVDALHASPVCTRASNANNSAELNDEGTKEAPLDIAMGAKVAEFIDVLAPRVVTIENVYAYRSFKAFKAICKALTRGGYFWDFDHLNAADYGVPQTRRRLILRAVKGALLPHLPAPVPWVGWYAAIEDLLPTLPTSQFAPWQLARLPAELQTFAFGNNAQEWGDSIVAEREPFHAVTGQTGGRARAFLVDSKNVGQEYGKLYRGGDEPAITVTVDGKPSHMPKALLVQGGNQWSPVVDDAASSPTVNNVNRVGNLPRAFLVNTREMHGNEEGSNAYTAVDADGERGLTVPHGQAPMFTVSATQNKRSIRAWMVNGEGAGEFGITPRLAEEPAATIKADAHGTPRAWLSAGRVVAMTPRALARFQSVPDWYALPEKSALACKVIGNGVPPLLMQRVYEGLRP